MSPDPYNDNNENQSHHNNPRYDFSNSFSHQENFRNDDANDYWWNSIVLLAAIVSLLIIFLITMIFYMIYFRLSSDLIQRRPRRRRADSRRHGFSLREIRHYHFTASPTDHGLASAAVEALPVFVYKEEDFSDFLRCSVCLCEFEENENGKVLPNCGHKFHVDCIDMWFYSHSTCPLCRQGVWPQPENEKVVGGDASSSAEREEGNSHSIKDVNDETTVDIASITLPLHLLPLYYSDHGRS